MDTPLPATIDELETPCMLVDIDAVKRNCQRMIDRCQQLGVELRPHMKTHKTVEGAELMTNGTKRQIVVSTIDEAQFYARNGFDDILWGSPIVKERISKRLVDLANTKEFHVMVDAEQGLDALIATPLNEGKAWSVFLEVDCGYGRTGCVWDSEAALTIGKKAAASNNISFQGLYVHCGNSYTPDPEKKAGIQQQTYDRLIALRDRLDAAGVQCKRYGCGSTPSCSKPIQPMGGLTEFHPGNYIFYDYMQVLVGSCEWEDIACRVATTVMSHKPEVDTLVVDCGWTALSLDGQVDRFPSPRGMAPVQDHPNLKMAGMTQEIGKLKAIEGEIDFDKYPLGTRLYLYPWHSCATACQHPVYYIHSGNKIVGTWTPTRGW